MIMDKLIFNLGFLVNIYIIYLSKNVLSEVSMTKRQNQYGLKLSTPTAIGYKFVLVLKDFILKLKNKYFTKYIK